MLRNRQAFGVGLNSVIRANTEYPLYANVNYSLSNAYSSASSGAVISHGSMFERNIRNYEYASATETDVVQLVQFGVDGGYVVERVGIVDSDDIILRLRTSSGNVPIDLFLKREAEVYKIGGVVDRTIGVPVGSVEMFGIALVGGFIAGLISKERKNRSEKRKKNSDATQDDKDSECGSRFTGDYFRLSHNLVCNVPGVDLITAQGRLDLKLFCGGFHKIEINVLDCCKKHDIDLWCSESNIGAAGADEKVIACIAAAIIEQGMAKMNPWCGIFFGGYAQLLALVGVAYVISAAFGWLAQFGHDTNLIGFGGRNRDSCLCGGNKPTIYCYDDKCRDVCSETGKKQDCAQCKYGCVYNDRAGKAIGYRHLKHPSGKACCPATQEGCGIPPIENLKRNCPDKLVCTPCEYKCEICHTYHWKFCPRPGLGKLTIDHLYGSSLPCCPGTPKPVAADFCPTLPGLGGPDLKEVRPNFPSNELNV